MTHSVSWVRDATIPQLADAALTADDLIVKIDEPRDAHEELELFRARHTRRIALDELVRRGTIESYSFV